MRLSTSTIYNEGISRIQTIQSAQVKLQNQIATGKRFSSPQEDPIAAARALEISTNMRVNSDYAYIRKNAETSLTTLELNLSSVTDHLLSAKSQLVAAGNGSLGDQERGFIAEELQNTLDGLVGLANTQDASGNYMYSGFKSDTEPFTQTAGVYNYQGAGTGQSIELEVGPNVKMGVNFEGNEVFQNGGTDTFKELQDIIAILKTSVTNDTEKAALNTGIQTAIGKMTDSLDNVLNTRAIVGGRLKQLDSLNTSGAALDVQYQSALSDIQDLDYAEALSEFSKTEVMLEAAQKTFSSTAKLSLFDYI